MTAKPSKPLKTLAQKDSRYWEQTLAFLKTFNERFDHLPAEPFAAPRWMGACHRDAEPWQETAHEIYIQAYRMWRNSLGPRTDPLFPGSMKSFIQDKPSVGSIVFVGSIRPSMNLWKAVGMITLIEPCHEGLSGAPRLYDKDGGPFGYSPMWTIKLFDGTTMRWHNCDPHNILTPRLTNHLHDWCAPMSREEAKRLAPGGPHW
ncbi:hypothetical protein HOU03_gp279 [Caulobacter phage CcrSC]|uniref:Uncharacterized protein n=1 Tax=Caulobacter phage CcrSC TaxID=2283272 RepID=A0A385EGQ9_9CAUD|nr:hypothetical protein HOU03_gp279 [Caulobacter phage CcrSC]AXQ69989.1 hypothetical protein CcrSC_gp407 [Caulobacter phage CcrSC]